MPVPLLAFLTYLQLPATRVNAPYARGNQSPRCSTQEPTRIACRVQYDGSTLSGWERKPDVPTVQGHLERALSDICDVNIPISAASKTDARTHALGQVFHFDPPNTLHRPR